MNSKIEMEENYRLVAEHSSDVIILLDKNGLFKFVSPSFSSTLGLNQDEHRNVSSHSFLEKVHPEDHALFQENIEALFFSKSFQAFEFRIHHNEGHWIYLEAHASPILSEKDDIEGAVVSCRNVSKRIIAEEKLSSAQEELRLSVQHENTMIFKFEKNEDSFIHTFAEGGCIYRLGYIPSYFIGKTIEEIYNSNMAPKANKQYERAWNGEDVLYELIGESGAIYIVSLKPSFKDGKVKEVLAICLDITEKKKIEEMIVKSEKLSLVGQLAASVAHEIRNPLTSVIGFTQFVKNEINPRYFDIISSELHRINLIISEFLSLSKPQAEVFRETPLSDILEDVCLIMEPQARMNGVQLTLNGSPSISMDADINHLKQAFINLLKNAIEASRPGSIVSVKCVLDSNVAKIFFKDDGCGISEDRLKILGEPFYTTKEKGTGLGFMITQKIINEHKGQIYVNSELDVGTTVEVVLPVKKEA